MNAGANEIEILVIAQDSTQKKYKISVYCERAVNIITAHENQQKRVFPNPVKTGQKINICTYANADQLQSAHLQLYTLQGLLLLGVPAQSQSVFHTLTTAGTYVLQLIAHDGIRSTFHLIVVQ